MGQENGQRATGAGSVAEQLGLGPQWQPAPASWKWQSLTLVDGKKLHVLILHTVGGTMAISLTPDDVRKFIEQARETVGGLHVAGVDDVLGL